MLERGVLPDLLPSTTGEAAMDGAHIEKFLSQGARQIVEKSTSSEAISSTFVTWTADRDAVRWLPRLDACAQAIVPAGDLLRQRWLRLALRYLGRLAYRERGVALTLDEKVRLEGEFDKLLAHQVQNVADRPAVTLRSHTTGTESDIEC